MLAVGINLVANGSFESGTANWSGNSGVEINPAATYGVPAAPSGTRVGEVEGTALSPNTTASYVQQNLTTVVGTTYIFSLQAVTRVNASTADRGILNVAGTNVLSFTTGNTWNSYTTAFTATSTSTIIRIYSNGSATGSVQPGDASGLIIDDVKVVPATNYISYVENAAAVALVTADGFVEDMNSANMASATITLTNAQAADQLLVNGSVAGSGTLGSGITWTRTNTLVTLSGNYTKAQYADALRLVQFRNTSEDPAATPIRDITLVVNDGIDGPSNTAHTYVTVVPVNDAPTAGNDSFTTNENVAITNQSVRANDGDVDNTTAQLTWSLVNGGTAAANGTVSVNANGTFTYTPTAYYYGTVSFTYRVCDPGPLCATATVTITVVSTNVAPFAGNDSFTTNEDVTIVNQSVSANDGDVDNTLAQLTWSLQNGGSAAANGTLTMNANGTFTWVPFRDFSGTVSFVYQVCDPGSRCATATVTITVDPVNDPPVLALSGTNLVTNGSFESGNSGWTGNSGAVEVNSASTYGVPAAPHGTNVMEVEGNSLSPNTTQSYVTRTVNTVVGQTYVYSIHGVTRSDNTGDAGYLSVNGVNMLAVRLTTQWTVHAVVFTATSTTTTIRITSLGSQGGYVRPGDGLGFIVDNVIVRPQDRSTSYTENAPPVLLTDPLPLVHDIDNANMTAATFILTNPQPSDRLLVNGSSAASGTLGSGITWTRTNTQVVFSGSRTKAQYAAALALVQFENTSEDPNSAVVRDITVTVNDGAATSNTAHAYVTVIAVNDAPVAVDDEWTVPHSTTLTGALKTNDQDVDDQPEELNWSLAEGGTAAEHGALTVYTNGTFNFVPDAGYRGTVTFSYTLCDPHSACASAMATIHLSSPLPVELLAFTGRNEATQNHLHWSTANEMDCDRFEVERSSDAISFVQIGSVAGAGNSQVVLQYAYIDQDPFRGVSYYRLRQVDTDGSFEYSPVIAITMQQNEQWHIATMDPTGLYALVSDWSSGVHVEVHSSNGQLINGRTEVHDGRAQVDLRGLAAGLYVIRVDDGTQVDSYKLMKQ